MDRKKIAAELLKLAKEICAVDERYQTEKGTFKKMTAPEGGGSKSKFNGCVRYMMATKGLKQENAEKLCAYIARKKGG